MSAIAWDLPRPFVLDFAVQEEELDGLGHTNNSVYLAWCDRVAWAHTDAVGLDLAAWRGLDRAMALQRTEIRFLAPSHAGDPIRIGNWITHCDGRLRASRRYQICRRSDGATLARVLSHYVCIEISTGRPKRMPPVFRERYLVEPEVEEALQVSSSPFAI